MQRKRHFISIYFDDALVNKRKKRDITISFVEDDELYKKCIELGSSKIRQIINVNSYKQLIEKAHKEDRSISNYIKHKLRVYFTHEKENPIS